MPLPIVLPDEVKAFVDAGALFAVNHSGGKDSQAMYAVVKSLVPRKQILVIHADLGDVEWPGVKEHIKQSVDPAFPLIICKNENRTLLSMVEDRGMFPSPKQRQCTSDLKRGPIERELRRFLKANPQFDGRIVNCIGLRAQESPDRAKKAALQKNDKMSVAGRQWLTWLPIHHFSVEQVFEAIAADDQVLHPAYGKGASRLSCAFCIMSSEADLKVAARENPELYSRYCALERRLGVSMRMPVRGKPQFLPDVTGIEPNPGPI